MFLKEIRAGRSLTIFTTDESDSVVGNTRIRGVRVDGVPSPELRRYWFGIGCWQWLHPDAHSDRAGDPDSVRSMLELDERAPEVRLEDVLRFCERAAVSEAHGERFNRAFDAMFSEIEAGSVVNWQDYFFVPSILKHAERLRSRKAFQTLHLHTSVPDSLLRSKFGMDLLRAMSLVDAVYLHTDEYLARAEKQLCEAELRVPAMRRFDLGVDRQGFDAASGSTDGLTQDQHAFVAEVLRSKPTVPHQFMNIDRIDPSKGTTTVIKAVRRFLDARRAAGEPLLELQRKYRFFFLLPTLGAPFDEHNLKTGRYSGHVRQLLGELVARYPGVVFTCGALQGQARSLIPTLLRDTTGISGGAQDGLNLAVMENAYVNRDRNTTVICGDGAGFAIHARTIGLADCAYFPRAGDVDAFVRAVDDTVRLQERDAWGLRDRKMPLVEHIIQRNDSVIVDR